jgi:N-methylhydantoinase A
VFGGRPLDTEVLRGPAVPGERCVGPAVWELPEATAVVPPGWAGSVDVHGTLVLEPQG